MRGLVRRNRASQEWHSNLRGCLESSPWCLQRALSESRRRRGDDDDPMRRSICLSIAAISKIRTARLDTIRQGNQNERYCNWVKRYQYEEARYQWDGPARGDNDSLARALHWDSYSRRSSDFNWDTNLGSQRRLAEAFSESRRSPPRHHQEWRHRQVVDDNESAQSNLSAKGRLRSDIATDHGRIRWWICALAIDSGRGDDVQRRACGKGFQQEQSGTSKRSRRMVKKHGVEASLVLDVCRASRAWGGRYMYKVRSAFTHSQ